MLTLKQLELIKAKMETENISISKLSRKVHRGKKLVEAVLLRETSNHFIEYRLVLWSQGKPIFIEKNDEIIEEEE